MSQKIDVRRIAVIQIGGGIKAHGAFRTRFQRTEDLLCPFSHILVVIITFIMFMEIVTFRRKQHILAFQIEVTELECAAIVGSRGLEFPARGLKFPFCRRFSEHDRRALHERALLRLSRELLVGKRDNAFALFIRAGSPVKIGTRPERTAKNQCAKAHQILFHITLLITHFVTPSYPQFLRRYSNFPSAGKVACSGGTLFPRSCLPRRSPRCACGIPKVPRQPSRSFRRSCPW